MGNKTSTFPIRWPARLRGAFAGLVPTIAVRRALTSPIYRLYEQRLLQQITMAIKPRHVGLILDGNRRYGRENNLTDHYDIYSAGADKLDDLLGWCAELGIPAITLWVLSTDNFRRSREEVSGIFAAIEAKLNRLAADPQIHRRQVRVRAVGRLEMLPASTL